MKTIIKIWQIISKLQVNSCCTYEYLINCYCWYFVFVSRFAFSVFILRLLGFLVFLCWRITKCFYFIHFYLQLERVSPTHFLHSTVTPNVDNSISYIYHPMGKIQNEQPHSCRMLTARRSVTSFLTLSGYMYVAYQRIDEILEAFSCFSYIKNGIVKDLLEGLYCFFICKTVPSIPLLI